MQNAFSKVIHKGREEGSDTMELLIDRIDSAIGTLLLISDGKSLCALDYADYEQRMTRLLQARYGHFQLQETTDPLGFSSQMRAYFTGDYERVHTIPVNPGGTAFQQQVWSALRAIPPGTVLSYRAMATKLGKPAAYRAVGAANALNPVAIVIPCHRLIGTNGALTGYAGGLTRKQWLLEHEGVDLKKFVYERTPNAAIHARNVVSPASGRHIATPLQSNHGELASFLTSF
jgi:methylated-DNA-[protein]-cysteine S-methyltransferase